MLPPTAGAVRRMRFWFVYAIYSASSTTQLTGDGRTEEGGERQRQVDDGDLLDGQPDALHVNGQVGQQR